MIMKKTVHIGLKTEVELQSASEREAIFTQAGKVVLVKSGDDVVAVDKHLSITLDPDDSALFDPGRYICIIVRAEWTDGTILESLPYFRPLEYFFSTENTGSGTDTSDATISGGADIRFGKTAYARGTKFTGEIANYDGTVEEGDAS